MMLTAGCVTKRMTTPRFDDFGVLARIICPSRSVSAQPAPSQAAETSRRGLLQLGCAVCTQERYRDDYLHNLISVQFSGRTRSSSVVTLARPSVSSSLQITNRSFRYASPHLWNQLHSSFRQPHSVHCPPGSPHPAHITSSYSHHLRSHHL